MTSKSTIGTRHQAQKHRLPGASISTDARSELSMMRPLFFREQGKAVTGNPLERDSKIVSKPTSKQQTNNSQQTVGLAVAGSAKERKT
jgi:hypothetical protein